LEQRKNEVGTAQEWSAGLNFGLTLTNRLLKLYDDSREHAPVCPDATVQPLP
jgi:hypothetical protein